MQLSLSGWSNALQGSEAAHATSGVTGEGDGPGVGDGDGPGVGDGDGPGVGDGDGPGVGDGDGPGVGDGDGLESDPFQIAEPIPMPMPMPITSPTTISRKILRGDVLAGGGGPPFSMSAPMLPGSSTANCTAGDLGGAAAARRLAWVEKK